MREVKTSKNIIKSVEIQRNDIELLKKVIREDIICFNYINRTIDMITNNKHKQVSLEIFTSEMLQQAINEVKEEGKTVYSSGDYGAFPFTYYSTSKKRIRSAAMVTPEEYETHLFKIVGVNEFIKKGMTKEEKMLKLKSVSKGIADYILHNADAYKESYDYFLDRILPI